MGRPSYVLLKDLPNPVQDHAAVERSDRVMVLEPSVVAFKRR